MDLLQAFLLLIWEQEQVKEEVHPVRVWEFVTLAQRSLSVLIDCRSPLDYVKGHIPGAVHAPMLSDTEKARVGTM